MTALVLYLRDEMNGHGRKSNQQQGHKEPISFLLLLSLPISHLPLWCCDFTHASTQFPYLESYIILNPLWATPTYRDITSSKWLAYYGFSMNSYGTNSHGYINKTQPSGTVFHLILGYCVYLSFTLIIEHIKLRMFFKNQVYWAFCLILFCFVTKQESWLLRLLKILTKTQLQGAVSENTF